MLEKQAAADLAYAHARTARFSSVSLGATYMLDLVLVCIQIVDNRYFQLKEELVEVW